MEIITIITAFTIITIGSLTIYNLSLSNQLTFAIKHTKIRYKTMSINKNTMQLSSFHGNIKWNYNKWFIRPLIKECYWGFHCSKKTHEAISWGMMLQHDQNPYKYNIPIALVKVRVRGYGIKGIEKEVWSGMKIIKVIKIFNTYEELTDNYSKQFN